MKKRKEFVEVIINFYDVVEDYWCVDAYETDTDSGEGTLVATISKEGEVTWLDADAKESTLVNDEINDFVRRLKEDKDIDNEDTVYVVKEEWKNDTEFESCVAGVFTTVEKAKACLKKCVNKMRKDCEWKISLNKTWEIEEDQLFFTAYSNDDDRKYNCEIIQRELDKEL